MFINPKKFSAVKTAFFRNLVVVLALFNLCTIFYVRVAIKSASAPAAESNLINQVVIYHFVGSLLMGYKKPSRALRSPLPPCG